MSQHNEIKQSPHVLRGFDSLVGLEEQDGVIRLGETLTPIVDHWELGDWAILRGEYLWSSFNFVNAVAAEFSFNGVGLPTNSRDLLIVDGASGRGGTTLQLGISTRAIIAATGAVVGNSIARDVRAAQPGFAAKSLGARIENWSGTDPANFTTVQEETNPTTQDYRQFLSFPYIVRPDSALVVVAGTVNLAIGVNFWGRLRPALRSEQGPF